MCALTSLALVLCVATVSASADDVVVLCPRGVQAPLTVLAESVRTQTPHRVTLVFGTAGGIARRAAEGDAADVVITSARSLDDLLARGAAVAGSRVEVGRVGVGVAVRAGTAVPDVSTTEALRAALLAAPSLGYADPARGGQAGTHFATVVDRLGLSATLKDRTRLFPEGLEALERTATGEIALSVAPISEILPVPGLTLAGPLPPPLQARLAYAAALLTKTRAPDGARAFLTLLASPPARAVLARGGLERE